MATDSAGVLRIGLIADIHYADKAPAIGRDYRAGLARTTEALGVFNARGVDAIVVLGDLIDSGGGKDLAHLEQIAAVLAQAQAPRHCVLGNHDLECLSKRAVLDRLGQRASFYSVDCRGRHLVFLDACFRADGVAYDAGPYQWTDSALPAHELAWLRADLAATRLPTAVFVHQRLDAAEGDGHGIAGREQVRGILQEFPQVRAVIQGHDHRGGQQVIGGIAYHTLQAVCQAHTGSAAVILEWPGAHAHPILRPV